MHTHTHNHIPELDTGFPDYWIHLFLMVTTQGLRLFTTLFIFYTKCAIYATVSFNNRPGVAYHLLQIYNLDGSQY